MLVLSRKNGQRVRIGGQISITIVKISNGGVRIGIEAPVEIPIVREELLDRFDLLRGSIEGILAESASGQGANVSGRNGNSSYQNRLRGRFPG